MFWKSFWFSFLMTIALLVYGVTADLPGVSSASQAAVASEGPDPLWCPSGVAPTPGANGCTKSYPTLYALISDIVNGLIPQPAQAGTIWIAMGSDASAGNIVIDGSLLSSWSTWGLTLQGGWDGISGSMATPGTSSFGKYIHVVNWKNQVSANRLSISGTSDTGLQVDTSGGISLQDVASSQNAGYGARLENWKAGNVLSITVSGTGTFDKNKLDGVSVVSLGPVTLSNISASNNLGNGGFVQTSASGLNQPVTVNGKNLFNSNGYNGLTIDSASPIQVSSVNAAGNGNNGGGAGLNLYTLNSKSGAGITVTGSNTLDSNMDGGLIANAYGPISLDGVSASANVGNGIDASNFQAGSIAGAGVSLTNAQVFKNNENGLSLSSNGPITAKAIKAGGNGKVGVSLSNPNQNGKAMDVNIASLDSSGNGGVGLSVLSYGVIWADQVTSTSNQGSGADLLNIYSANVSDVHVSASNFGMNQAEGLQVYSFGSITVDNTKASSNGSQFPSAGIYLDNCRLDAGKCRGIGDIKLTAGNFGSNTGSGLLAISNGAISIADTVSELNGQHGFDLKNNGNMDVYCSQLNNNKVYGIRADLPGTLSLYNVSFSGNGAGDLNVLGGGSFQKKEYRCRPLGRG